MHFDVSEVWTLLGIRDRHVRTGSCQKQKARGSLVTVDSEQVLFCHVLLVGCLQIAKITTLAFTHWFRGPWGKMITIHAHRCLPTVDATGVAGSADHWARYGALNSQPSPLLLCQTSSVEILAGAIGGLPRPLVIQCSSALAVGSTGDLPWG